MTEKEMKKSMLIYTVDAFTDEPFCGNPAAVCLIPRGLKVSDETLQAIAREMNLSDTAFVEHQSDDSSFHISNVFKLRWFTPTNEMRLCGHATLASAAVLMFSCENTSAEIQFNSMSGPLIAKRKDNSIILDFPLNPTQKMKRSEVKNILQVLCDESMIKAVEYSPTTKNLLVCLHDDLTRADLERLKPDSKALQDSDKTGQFLGVIVTLRGSDDNMCIDKAGKVYDFVSRYFVPWVGIPEDPATGSTHTVLADFWRKKLGVSTFYAYQCSRRGGQMTVAIRGDRVEITGKARIILKGQMFI